MQDALTNKSTVLTPADEPVLVIQRRFEAPRALVYKCYTEPAHMTHFWGPRDATTISRVDLRPGGVWHTQWHYAGGGTYGYTSVYVEITPPERIVYRDAPDGWHGGLDGLPPVQIHSTIELAEHGSGTEVTVTVRFTSIEARDHNVERGFAGMVTVGNDRLEEYLATLAAAGN